MNLILLGISILLVIIAGILDAYRDKWMMTYINLPKTEQQKVNKNWFSKNPLAKWKDGKWGVERADNILIYKYFKIKTKWLTDNCNDGWHAFKSIEIVCLLTAIVLPLPGATIIGKITILIILGIAWNVPFNLVLNKTNKKK